jgi:DNA topoisomerase-1
MGRLSHDEVMRKEGEGIVRLSSTDGFIYRYLRNGRDVQKREQTRIERLGIPPGWSDVWISDKPDASIQAIGLDSKGRKQYMYNHIHVATAEREKFLRLKSFIRAMPRLERALSRDEKLPAYARERVIVTMLTLVRLLHIRVGKEQYARQNHSYGVSSLEKKHLTMTGEVIKLRFMGKSRQRLSYTFRNPAIRAHLRALLRLEGAKLFQYIDIEDNVRRVTDGDLNEYIQQHMGTDFTVKDFRTYAANYHFINELLHQTLIRVPMTAKRINKNIRNAVERTARYLRHTRSISKKSYIMNFVVDLYRNDPEYFIANKNRDVNTVLLGLLTLYQREIMQI